MITYKITIVSYLGGNTINEYETQILPNVGDILYFAESMQYEVMQRKFKPTNNSTDVILVCDKTHYFKKE